MAEEIKLDVITVAHSEGLRQGARDLREMRREADRTGDSFHTTSEESFDLERAIAHQRTEIKRLNEEFRQTGDRHLFRDMARERRELNELLRVAGNGIGAGSDSPLDLGAAGIKPMHAVIGALVGALVAAAPTIGAMVGGLLGGAIGTAALAGGILTAVKSPAVRQAAHSFVGVISDEFFRRSDVFVKPVIAALHELESAFKDLRLPEALSIMAPLVKVITKGLTDMLRNAMPGFVTALSRMGPFAEEAAKGFAQFGTTLGKFMDNITASKGAVAGLQFSFALINGLIAETGVAIKILSDLFLQWMKINRDAAAVASGFAAALGQADLAAEFGRIAAGIDRMLGRQGTGGLPQMTVGVASFGAAADEASRATGHLAGALTEAHTAFLQWQGALINVEEALDNLQAALKASNGSIDVHNEKGRAARQALLLFADAAREAAQKKLDETHSVKEAEKVYESYRKQLVDSLVAAGKTRKEAERLARAWLGVPPRVETKVVTTFVTKGSLPKVTYTNLPAGEIMPGHRASGGPIGPGDWIVGEEGPERMRIDSSGRGYVWPSRSGRGGASSRGGGGGTHIVLDIRGGDDELKRLIRKWVRIEGAGSVQAAFGR